MGAAKGRKPWLQRKRRERERGMQRRLHQKNTSLKLLAEKMIETDFCEFLQLVELEGWSFKVRELGCGIALRVLPYSWREGR